MLLSLKSNIIFKSIHAVYLLQLLMAVSFSIVAASLFLYITTELLFPVSKAASLVGLFLACSYLFHLIAGYITRFKISNYQMLLLSAVLHVAGFSSLCWLGGSQLKLSLLLLAIGGGIGVPSINMLIAKSHTHSYLKRERSYLFNYGYLSFGFLIGYSLVGESQLIGNFRDVYFFGLLFSAGMLALVLVMFLRNRDHSISVKHYIFSSPYVVLILCLACCFCLVFFLPAVFDQKYASFLLVILSIVVLFKLLGSISSLTAGARRKMIVFFILNFVSIGYFIVQSLLPMLIMYLVNSNVERHIAGILIPAAWVDNIAGIVAIIACPILAFTMYDFQRRKGVISPFLKLAVGFLFGVLAMLVLVAGCMFLTSSGKIHISSMMFFYSFHALSAIFISPVMYAMVTVCVPLELCSSAMGLVCCNAGLGALIASHLTGVVAMRRSLADGGVSLISVRSFFMEWSVVLCALFVFCVLAYFLVKRSGKTLFSSI